MQCLGSSICEVGCDRRILARVQTCGSLKLGELHHRANWGGQAILPLVPDDQTLTAAYSMETSGEVLTLVHVCMLTPAV